MNHTFIKNGITFDVEMTADQYNQLRVIARNGNQTIGGKIGATCGKLWPRIDFLFVKHAQWLVERADRKLWCEDDDQKTDLPSHAEFSIPDGVLRFLQKWTVLQPAKPAFNKNAKIVLRTGVGGAVDEKKSFNTIDELRQFLSGRGVELSENDYYEIMKCSDTQFDHGEFISDDGVSGYFGTRRYEIEIH